MYAIIESGGSQYRVSKGQRLRLQKMAMEPGNTLDFSQVLMVCDGEQRQVGAPFVKTAKVSAEIIKHGRGNKIKILKFKRRKHHMKQMGHRQDYTEV